MRPQVHGMENAAKISVAVFYWFGGLGMQMRYVQTLLHLLAILLSPGFLSMHPYRSHVKFLVMVVVSHPGAPILQCTKISIWLTKLNLIDLYVCAYSYSLIDAATELQLTLYISG